MRILILFFSFLIFLSPINKIYGQASAFGVNLAGMEFNGTPAVPTSAEMSYYNSKGLKLIRIPFLWERIQPTLGAALSTTYLGQLDGIVTSAKTYGMSILLDMHNYARYPYNGSVIGAGTATIANYQDVWTKIASHYANETTLWGYDIMNEPNNLGGANWQTIAQAAITGIRSVDNNHIIVIEGDNWSHGNTWVSYNNGLKNLSDSQNKLVFEAHQYFDSNGSGAYSNTTVAGNSANSNTGVTLITPFVNWLNTNNKRGIVGEYGVPNNSDTTNWKSLLSNFLSYLKTNCVGGTYWAGGPSWGSYILSCEPNAGKDKPQMSVLSQFTDLGTGCTPISAPTGINFSFENEVKISAYPNPFNDIINLRIISVESEKIKMVVYDVRGVSISSNEFFTNENITLGDHLPSGVYFLSINYKGKFKVIKLVKLK